MLVLTRKVDELIIVNGGQLIVKVLGVKGKRVRLAFCADQDVKIERAEIARPTHFTGESPEVRHEA